MPQLIETVPDGRSQLTPLGSVLVQRIRARRRLQRVMLGERSSRAIP